MIAVPSRPLPEIKTLFRSLLSSQNADNLWSSGQSHFFYSRGAWALCEAIKVLLGRRGKREDAVWFPDYFCNGALIPVRQLSVKLNFYPICENVEPNWDALEEMVGNIGAPDIFVLTHYFGFPGALKKAKSFCESHGIDLIEDAAHVLLPCCGIGETENVVIYSPRKILALPEGGILVVPKKLEGYVKSQKTVIVNRTVVIWFMKRLAQKVMIWLRIPWHKFQPIRNNEHSDVARPASLSSSSYSVITYKLLHIAGKKVNEIIQKRRENYNLLLKGLTSNNITPLFSCLPDGISPYVFPFLVGKDRNSILQKLRSRGVPAHSWPDLPPEVLKDAASHLEAVRLQEHIILFPVHQSLTGAHLKYMVETTKSVLGPAIKEQNEK